MEPNLGMNMIWWTGVVESRQDPLKVGRCQVRIAGAHTEKKSTLPTADLPWAHPIIPLNDNSSLQIKEGDYVVGFYFDGHEPQVPIIMGILPGIPVELGPASVGFTDPRSGAELSGAPRLPDASPSRYPSRLNEPTFSRLARNEKIFDTPVETKKLSIEAAVPTAAPGVWSEPMTPYDAVYPYNRVMETESGHILEFDDTPGAERIHIYHRSGTFEEVHPDGTKVTKIQSDAYEIILADKNIYVKGDLNITSLGSVNILGKSIKIESETDVSIIAGTSFTTLAGTEELHTAGAGITLLGVPINLN
jgi:hypothetical protein